jgi:hypothetical protein
MKAYLIHPWSKTIETMEVRETAQMYVVDVGSRRHQYRKNVDAFPTPEAAWRKYLHDALRTETQALQRLDSAQKDAARARAALSELEGQS